MGERPEGMSLDRIDTDKGYTPENCRWADQFTQVRGQRKTVKFDGRTLRDICEERGLNFRRAYLRHRRGHGLDVVLFDGPLYSALWSKEPIK